MFDNSTKTFKDMLEIMQTILLVAPQRKEKVNFDEFK